MVVPFEETTLRDLRPGAIFVAGEGVLAVKSKYYHDGPFPQCMCILLDTGEYACFPDKNDIMVREVFRLAPHQIITTNS